MNKILPIILVVVLSGCTANTHMRLQMKYQQEYDTTEAKCRSDEPTMVGYVNCMDNLKEKQNLHRVENSMVFINI